MIISNTGFTRFTSFRTSGLLQFDYCLFGCYVVSSISSPFIRLRQADHIAEGKARPQPRELRTSSFRLVCGIFNVQRTYFKTLSFSPGGVELTTSSMAARCSTNWATGARYKTATTVTQYGKWLKLGFLYWIFRSNLYLSAKSIPATRLFKTHPRLVQQSLLESVTQRAWGTMVLHKVLVWFHTPKETRKRVCSNRVRAVTACKTASERQYRKQLETQMSAFITLSCISFSQQRSEGGSVYTSDFCAASFWWQI